MRRPCKVSKRKIRVNNDLIYRVHSLKKRENRLESLELAFLPVKWAAIESQTQSRVIQWYDFLANIYEVLCTRDTNTKRWINRTTAIRGRKKVKNRGFSSHLMS